MSNRILVCDRNSGKALWLATEICLEGLKLFMSAGATWISRTVTGEAIDAAYRAFEARDPQAFGELMFPSCALRASEGRPTQPATGEAAQDLSRIA